MDSGVVITPGLLPDRIGLLRRVSCPALPLDPRLPAMVNIQDLIDEAKCYQTVRELRWKRGRDLPSLRIRLGQ